ncbi:MAG: hypothetical protein OXF06_00955 [Bacteroidetes bacterium]|nr:hypothetical protein [Bacteroidota bacterium]
MTSKSRTHTIIGLLLLIALVIGACDSQITDPETSIHNKATEQIVEGAPAFEDQLGDGCLRWRDSEDFSAFRKTADQPDWPTCKEVREQRKQKIETTFNALKALYRATTTNSSEWLTNRGWDTTNVPTSMEAFNDWYGLTVVGGDLTGLTLDIWIDLTEPLPPEIGNLTNLTRLQLAYGLTGPIPPEIGNLTNLLHLDIDLGSNQPWEPIPAWIGNLTNLRSLYLNWVNLANPIPKEIGNLTNLTRLGLGGSLCISKEIGNLTNLTHLSQWSSIQCTIPKEIGNLTNLTRLQLAHVLTGPIPKEIGNLTNLTHLHLRGFGRSGNLEGPIPKEIGNLINLTVLKLDGIYGNGGLTGLIPKEIGNLTNLTYFHLNQNQLTGELPQGLVGATKMEDLRFQENAGLCAPANTEFQTWLNGISTVNGPTCSN